MKSHTQQLSICFFGTYDRTYTSNIMMKKAMELNGMRVVEVNAHIPVTRLDSPKDMTWKHLVRRIFQKYQIFPTTIKHWKDIKESDVIYVGYPGHFDVFFAFIIAKLANKKLIFNPLLIIYTGFSEEQGILNKHSLMGLGMKLAEGLVYKLCDRVFADTPLQESYLKKVFGVPAHKLRVLAIGADDAYYAYTPYTNKSKKLNIVYYGLYSPIHGLEYLIEAAHLLKNEKDITFTMVGNGNTFQKNYDLAKKLQLKNMIFYNNTPLSEHPAIIQKGDIFLGFLTNHPTVERVIPNKVYQGLALGKVVLTTDAPVTRSVFKDQENMFLVKPEDANALASAILELKNNPTKRSKIAQAGYELFIRKYTPRAVGRELKQYINEVIHE
jgi:glycosyltransferase involved in cell wall biosynthesis